MKTPPKETNRTLLSVTQNGDKSFPGEGPSVWNTIPRHIHDSLNTESSKRAWKIISPNLTYFHAMHFILKASTDFA